MIPFEESRGAGIPFLLSLKRNLLPYTTSRRPAHPGDPLPRQTSPSRRTHSRVESPGGVYVYWRATGDENVAPVVNLSLGGLFIETNTPTVPGVLANLHFLVEEGQIRADAVVRHAMPGLGLGLKFTAVHNEDRRRLANLMERLRRSL